MRILENFQTNGAGNQERKKLTSADDTDVCSVGLCLFHDWWPFLAQYSFTTN